MDHSLQQKFSWGQVNESSLAMPSRENLLPFKIYKNWDIVKGFCHGVITILCNVLGSVYVFFLGFEL